MQLFDVYESRSTYEDRVNQLKKDYTSPKQQKPRKMIKRVLKLFKRDNV